MTVKSAPWKSICTAGAVLVILAACAVGVGGPGYDGEVGYVGGYYEPWGYDYGGWGGRYRVGPPRGGFGHDDGRGHPGGGEHADGHGGPGGHSIGRAAPSIPGRPRR